MNRYKLLCIASACLISLAAYSQVAPPPAYGTTLQKNYMRTWDATAPQQSPAVLVTGALTDVKQNTQYFDGFGRPLQTVQKQASPLGSDVVSAACYDPSTGNEIYKYPAFTSNAATTGDVINDGNFKQDPFQEQAAFYGNNTSGPIKNQGETYYYGKINHEASPLGRVLNAFAPGNNWAGSEAGPTPHNSQQSLCANTATDNVQEWSVATVKSAPEAFPQAQIMPTNNGAYPADALYKRIVTDEQGLQSIEFTDKDGEVILKKVQNSTATDNGSGSAHSGWLCTYYVYDDYGNLRFIIPPNVVQFLDGSWTGMTQSWVDELCYYFEYDNLNRLVISKNPGTLSGAAGEVWMVYDQRDRVVMRQDGYQRSQKLWKYFQYDNLDRITASGLLTDPSASTTSYTDLNTHLNAAATSISYPGLAAYTTESLGQTFYDNYLWMSSANSSTLASTIDATGNGTANAAFSTTYNASPTYAQQMTKSIMTHGLAIGTKTEVMGSSQGQYLYAISFYDSKGRVIQTQNINYLQGTDILTTQYSWDGKVLAKLVYNTVSSVKSVNPQSHWVSGNMNYDAEGRLLSITKTISSTVNGQAVAPYTTTVVTNQYNEEGMLQKKTLGNNLESLTYDFNIRGWILGANRDYAKNPSSTTNYFGYDLGYDKTPIVPTGGSSIGAYAAAVFNGGIGGVVWKSKGDGVSRKYDFSYDDVNRLSAANFNQYSGTGFDKTAGIDFSVSNLTYDANGNIGSMQQNGFLLGGSQAIDNLTYSYVNGKNTTTQGNYTNRLLNVMDAGNMPSSTLGDLHYPSSKPASGNTDYNYDANGNITSDYNRGISAISYWKDMNLPNTITVAGKGTIQYIYDAAGNKLQKQTIENTVTVNGVQTSITTTTKYIDGFVYKTVYYGNTASLSALNTNNTDIFQFTNQEEGRIRFKPAVGAVTASYAFDYFMVDHLGNVRMVLTDEAPVDIYPAATLEGSLTDPASLVYYEKQFYAISASDTVDISSLPWWSSSWNYVNNNGNPVNPNPNSGVTAQSAKVYKLNGQTGDKYGLGITLKVMAGDKVNIYGKSVWHNSGVTPGSYPIATTALTAFIAAFTGTPVVSAETGVPAISTLGGINATTVPLSSLLTNTQSQMNPTVAPKAAINWILFDDQFRPVNMGSTVSSGTDLVNSTGDVLKSHAPPTITTVKNGYLYVYCSNESAIDVYFDNLQVALTHGPIVEETHYYPAGLAMAGISDKAFGKQPNYYHYQGDEIQAHEWNDGTGLEEYDFSARPYDQQLGVWHNQDPKNQFASPYTAMANNWPHGVDPYGESFWGTVGDIALIAGSAVAAYFTAGESLNLEYPWIFAGAVAAGGYAGASLESSNWNPGKWDGTAWKGIVAGELIGASLAVGGEEIAGEISTSSSVFSGAQLAADQIAVGAANGVGQGLLSTSLSYWALGGTAKRKETSNKFFDALFVSTVSGAITGALGSKPISDGIDQDIFGHVLDKTNILKGAVTSVAGTVITTGFKEADSKGWSWGHFFDISTQLPTLTEKLSGKAMSYGVGAALGDGGNKILSGFAKAYSSAWTSAVLTNMFNGSSPWEATIDFTTYLKQLPPIFYGIFTPK